MALPDFLPGRSECLPNRKAIATLSIMETSRTHDDREREAALQQLQDIERAQAATWLDHPATPWWWAPYFAVWSGALVLSVGYLPGWGSALGNLALVAASAFLIGYQRRHRGTWPTGDVPQELHRPLWMLLVGAVAVMAAATALGFLVSVWVSAVVTGVLAGLLVWRYERDYARAAERARRRLG